MKKRTKISLIFLSTAIILSVIAFILSIKLTSDFEKSMKSADSQKEEVKIHDVIITETKEGVKYWEIYAKIGEYDSKKTNAILTDIVGNYYKEGKVVLSFTAPKGFYNSDNKLVKLHGGAYVVAEDGNKVKADEISWVSTTDKIKAKGNVKIFKGTDFIATGNSADINTDFTNLEIMGNTQVKVFKTEK